MRKPALPWAVFFVVDRMGTERYVSPFYSLGGRIISAPTAGHVGKICVIVEKVL